MRFHAVDRQCWQAHERSAKQVPQWATRIGAERHLWYTVGARGELFAMCTGDSILELALASRC